MPSEKETVAKMTELELYKFITDKNIEYHWNGDEVYACLYVFNLEEFAELLGVGGGIFDDGGFAIRFMGDYVSIDMKPICDYFGIDMEKIFKKEPQNE